MRRYLLIYAMLFCLLTGCGARNETPSVIEPIPVPPGAGVAEPVPQPLPSDDADLLEEAAKITAPENGAPSLPQAEATPALGPADPPSSAADPDLPAALPVSDGQARSRAYQEAAPYADGDTGAIASELLRLINGERALRDCTPLGIEPSLQLAAELRVQETINDLSHTRPDGSSYHTVFDEAEFPYAGKYHGENLAVIQVGAGAYDAAAVAQALLNEWSRSPGHEQNLFSSHYVQTGIGITLRTQGDVVLIGAAQLFASL